MGDYNTAQEILDEVINDNFLKFKEKSGEYLQGGICPDCGKKELFISKKEPWVLKCGRSNNCGYSESTRERYSFLFEKLSERYPSTEVDKNATAKAFLHLRRGFDLEKIAGFYTQSTYPIYKDGKKLRDAATVKVPLPQGNWHRFIDAKDIKDAGKKNTNEENSYFKHSGWEVPGVEYNAGDFVFITEAMFKTWALLSLEKTTWPIKSIAAIAASNFPRNIIKANQGKGVVWVLAYDNDKAGLEAIHKFLPELINMGEAYRVALTRPGYDWDDEYRNNKLDNRYLKEALWRGCVETSDNYKKTAFWHWAKRQTSVVRYEHKCSLWRCKVNRKRADDSGLTEVKDGIFNCWALPPSCDMDIETTINNFIGACDFELISSCKPTFLYAERNQLTRELSFFVRVDYANGAPRVQESLDRSAMESCKGFHRSLVGLAAGSSYYGNDHDFREMYEGWFKDKSATEEIRALRFIGYDTDFAGYCFPNYGFKDGKFIKKNDIGLIQTGDKKIKTKLEGLDFVMPNKDAPLDWLGDINTAFGINGLVTLAFWFGTFYSEQIRKELGWFPFLEMSGRPGTGKSTLLEFLWKASGRAGRYEGINPAKYSTAARGKTMTKLSAMPMVLIEGDVQDAKQAFDMNELKDAFNGAPVRGIGVPTGGGETIEPPFRGGVIVAQNADADVDKPMISRFIHLHFTESHFSEQGFNLLQTFRDMSHEDASAFMYQTLINEPTIVAFILKKYREILPTFKKDPRIKMTRIQEIHALILACFHGLELIFNQQTAAFTASMQTYLLDRAASRQKRMADDHPDVQTFWEVFEAIRFKTEKDEDYHYSERTKQIDILNHSKDDQLIAINLVEVANRADVLRFRLPMVKELKRLLTNSTEYKYLGNKPVKSKITDKSKHCWVFEKPQRADYEG